MRETLFKILAAHLCVRLVKPRRYLISVCRVLLSFQVISNTNFTSLSNPEIYMELGKSYKFKYENIDFIYFFEKKKTEKTF